MLNDHIDNQTQQSLNQKLTYQKPVILPLGSLEKIQASYSGRNYDGPDGRYYYS